MSHKLAVDFGTTNTVVARWNDVGGAAEIVNVPGASFTAPGQPPLVPSLVYMRDGQSGQITLGQMVRDQRLDREQDKRLFRDFKRGIVTLPAPPPREIDGAPWADRDIGTIFLQRLMRLLPVTDEGIDPLVLTAPVAAFAGYLDWLDTVVAGLVTGRVYIVDEATAAALGYAVTEPGAAVLVLDFGGGTLDLSLVQLPEDRHLTGGFLDRLRRAGPGQHTARIIARAGRVIGGSDVDHWLLAWTLDQAGVAAADLDDGLAALLIRCEQAKITLSTETQAAIAFNAAGKTHTVTVTREALEHLLEARGFYAALRYALDKLMLIAHRRGVFREDIHHVLLVGGTSLMPSVQAALQAYFGGLAVRAEKPFTAVAEGALLVAAGYGLDDYIERSCGLRHLDPETGQPRYEEIIPMGSSYPLDKPVEVLLAAAHPGQTEIELIIGEIHDSSDSLVEVQYEGGQAVFLAQGGEHSAQYVVPIETAGVRLRLDPASGAPGEARVKASFTVDAERRLRLTAADMITRKTLLQDVALVTLRKQDATPGAADDRVTGAEPHLVIEPERRGQRRLSLQGVASLFNRLSPDAISPAAAAEALRSASFSARHNAAVALRKRGDRQSRLVMQAVLHDGGAPSRATVARHLHGFSWFAAEPLIRQALQDSDSRVREAAMYTLCQFNDPRSYALMAETLQYEADNVREAAAYALRDCQHPEAVPVLEAALLADDAEVRVLALEALSANDTPQAVPVIRRCVHDRDPSVRYAAVASLLEIEGARCLGDIAALIHDTSGTPRQAILAAFFHATNYLKIDVARSAHTDALLDALGAALLDEWPAARQVAVWPLAWMRHGRADDMLWEAYRREQDQAVRVHILRVAVGLMSAVGEAMLDHARHSHDERIRAAAEAITAASSGVVVAYDALANEGTGFTRPVLGR